MLQILEILKKLFGHVHKSLKCGLNLFSYRTNERYREKKKKNFRRVLTSLLKTFLQKYRDH